jgi:hypothetical protein
MPNIHKINVKSNNLIDNIPDHLDIDAAKERIDRIIRDWSYNINEKKNLRILLSTLHEVWTCDSVWQEVSLKKLLEEEKYLNVI